MCVSSCILLFASLSVIPRDFTRAMNERQIKVRVLVTVALAQEGETEEGRRRIERGGDRGVALTTLGGLMCQRDSWGDKTIQDGTAIVGLSLSLYLSLSIYLCLCPPLLFLTLSLLVMLGKTCR